MCALCPSPFPSFLWPLEEPNEQQFYFSRNTIETTNTPASSTTPASSILDPAELLELHQSTSFTANYNSGGDPNVVKKLNHNASERDRRKMMNNLYSSLRSLLPTSDQMKKLSIPATVSRVLKYIPQIQQQVERLCERKEELISKLYKEKQQKITFNKLPTKKTSETANDQSMVSATKLTDTQVVVQISTYSNAFQNCPLSQLVLFLEEQQGLSLINSSSFQSFLGKIFITLHLQVEGPYRLECEALSEKLVSLYEKRELLFS